MSYDIEIGDLDFSPTYNFAPMFRRLFDNPLGIKSLNGMKGRECVVTLLIAVSALTVYRSSYESLEDPNGWGTINQCRRLLLDMADACIKSPDDYVEVLG